MDINLKKINHDFDNIYFCNNNGEFTNWNKKLLIIKVFFRFGRKLKNVFGVMNNFFLLFLTNYNLLFTITINNVSDRDNNKRK